MDGDRVLGIRNPWAEPPAPGEAIQIAEGVLWMRLPLPMALDHVNIYALDDGDGWTVIDTGLSSNKTRRIWQTLMDGPLSGKPIKRVVVTHHHPDHVGNAGWLQSEHGAELVTSRTSWLFARMLTLDVQETWPQETLDFYRSAGMSPEVLNARMQDRPFNFADTVYPMPLGFTRIQQGDVIRMGGRDWDVHMGNGHAPEHATFWSRDDNLVLSGDQILSSISPNLGVYATEPMADPVSAWMEACERLQTLARPDHLVLGGHKLPFTGLPLRMKQLIDNHHSALERLLDHLDEPKSAADCFLPLFKRTIRDGEYGLALVEAVAHMNHLYHIDAVTRTQRADGAWLYQRKG
ncbi:MBL fold metallo-hydrolase [Ruegeria sp. HKCCD4318-2]|uniref:MBL fold metallo-hydrolase n=1 Tax=unclassified Ruegeria TaxID=2625375 RepID=UPI0014878C1A|nr:MBL fold metallo-hydrolase [Ruegeria sp. HKCCD4318-2]NOD76507.1 MBL fold metallo-hydrolase [Ruegeria sp. HKCCD4332]NOD89227.1 MBL fold metallo-hydrolase [Ruegeria sp. HKCCD4318]NOE13610.1 MBL fold metallo-hydrolase [Ruegeria sp. HKCCD4318-2]NOG07639.1 MBL fold metallo-hydrolase [Ruegeria sp. HKCCD4315]